MGAWGIGIFDNDFACDFWAQLRNSEDALSLLIETLGIADGEKDSYLEIDDANSILVCIVVILGFNDRDYLNRCGEAKLTAYFRPQVVEFLDKWQSNWDENYKSRKFGDNLSIAQYCSQKIDVILFPKNSEAYELWKDAGDIFYDWKKEMDSFKEELAAI